MDDYKSGIVECENLSKKDEIEEVIMLGLRCKLGVDTKKLQEMGYDISKNSYYEEYIKQGVLKQEGNVLFLNQIFYHISNTIISNLLP